MKKRQILINAIASAVQIIAVSGVLFVLYKFLLNTIGIKQLGIWSLVFATTSLTQLANLGLSGSVVKFVAKYVARDEQQNIADVIQTAALSVAAFVGIVLLIAYPLVREILALVISDESLPLALSVLPYAFVGLWIIVITGVFQAGLDGYQRIDLRSMLLIASAVLHLFLCLVLVPSYGLIGVAYARIFQSFSLFISSWLLLKNCVPSLPVFPYRWNTKLFKEIIGYGINIQVISVATASFDPITKALLSKFGGLSMVGYYEMASKMIKQLRALIVSANQVLIPAIADLYEKIPQQIKSVYSGSYRLLFYFALPLYSIIIVVLPLISIIWIGQYEEIFVYIGILLSIGYFVHTLAAPSFFINLGTGELRWNVVGYITIAILNAGLGYILGHLYGGIGTVTAWIISLIVGTGIISVSYHVINKISLKMLIPRSSRYVFVICLSGILLSFMIRYKTIHQANTGVLNIVLISMFIIIIGISCWLHPLRKKLTELIKVEFF